MELPLTLQAVIVHIGQAATKGHYVVYTKMAGGPGWARCDDDRVQWVSELEALAQEEFLLVYAPPVVPQKKSKKQSADQAATAGQPVTLDRGTAQDPEDSSLTGAETPLENISDAQSSPEESRVTEGNPNRSMVTEDGPLTELETMRENITVKGTQPPAIENAEMLVDIQAAQSLP